MSAEDQPQVVDIDQSAAFQRRLGLAIRQLRERAGWTQQDVVDRLGQYDTSWLSAAENGRKNLSARHLARFESLFGVRLEFLSSTEAELLDRLRASGPSTAKRMLRAAESGPAGLNADGAGSASQLRRSAEHIEQAVGAAAETLRSAAEAAADALRDAADALEE